MTLLVDAGNSGVKWARLADGQLAGIGAVTHRGVEPEAWQARLAALAPAPRRVLVANVAGPAFEARFRSWAARQWRLTPEFPAASAERLGVRNAYVRPDALGIDRWLAMLAAWRAAGVPLLVASAGTAFTVDLVDGEGLHRGGCIVPGERLMREALHAQTSGVAAAALLDRAVVDGAFGVNTAGAVQQGARLALASLVDRAARVLEAAAGVAPRIFVAGGAAAEIAPLVTRAVELAPHLVLEGLALVAAEVPA
ncbi:MAG TPA: type III pantothenate kinase [Steroidobacteraceae bacterium]|nr:type III pantothenate kinase [Steroidobacteraceae bacterium]